MSKDIIVLTPNGRRQKIHCTPDTSIIQVLEDVCRKQGFQPSDYDLKHHNNILDLTATIRFTNLPNKAMLEMVEAQKKREETIVTIGLQLEDGERRTADFPPNTSLYGIIMSLAPTEFKSLSQPTISYMRQEVVGEAALKDKTLRQLGLIKGRAVMRLLNKQEEGRQANVSAVYRRPIVEKKDTKSLEAKSHNEHEQTTNEEPAVLGPSANKHLTHQFQEPEILTKFKESCKKELKKPEVTTVEEEIPEQDIDPTKEMKRHEIPMEVDKVSPQSHSQENLERRLKIEEEVTFLGAQKAIAFTQPDNASDDIDDLPDDFYDLTIEEVRRLYNDLQQQRLSLENTPLISSTKREDLKKQVSEQRLNSYNNVVVRIQFPDHIILQGIFSPKNTIEDVKNFIKDHLRNPEKEFLIFTTPFKETLDPKMTLMDARFVPCVHIHFKWLDEDTAREPYLKEEIYTKMTASDAASILASKYRSPSRRKFEDSNESANRPQPSTSKSSKVPKWFKN